MRKFRLLLFFLVAPLTVLPAQSINITGLTVMPERITVSFKVNDLVPTGFLQALYRGQTTRVMFRIRLYRADDSGPRITGDTIVRESIINREGEWDIFENRFFISTDDVREPFQDGQDFIDAFFQVSPFSLDSSGYPKGRYYILLQATLEKVKLIPPLNLVYLFSSSVQTTDWYKSPDFITGDGGS